jgi:hypothetical protein
MDDKTRIALNIAEGLGCANWAFRSIAQADGPPVAYYSSSIDGDCSRYAYQTFSWRNGDHRAVINQVASFAVSLDIAGKSIVWRCRPEFTYGDGEYYFYCRLHVLPYEVMPGNKLEGEETPEAPPIAAKVRIIEHAQA